MAIDPHAAYDALRWDRTDARYDRFRASLAGPPVPWCPEYEESALTAAIWDNDPTAVALLLRAGADPDGNPDAVDPPVIDALGLAEGWRPMVLLLLAFGADLERRGMGCRTALHAAVATTDVERVRLILDLGGAIDAPAEDDTTPLWHAALGHQQAICRLLLDRGANPLLADDCHRRTPADLLRRPREEQDRLAAILEAAGAEWGIPPRGGPGAEPAATELLAMLEAAEAEWRRREPDPEATPSRRRILG